MRNVFDASVNEKLEEQTSNQLEGSFDPIAPTAISNAVRYTISQPDGVEVSEIVVRPANQEM